ncbi:SDR family oxidoreductase [Myroides injenensis]|uniref:SDR family oxidoreductase n=1 Tax=Myroides injenensis TaxID=1183151 RepID=UPI0002898D74|nr:SDR family oxidoreductase [Myroides injenensis]
MKKYKNRVLLAGATGYLGNYLLKELKREGYWVRVLIRSKEQKDIVTIADEVFIGEVTDSSTLSNITKDIEWLFSTIGITRQKDGLTYMDVDYQGNMNLLQQALTTNVKHFVYISAINGDKLRHLKIFQAKEGFVDQLKESGLDYRIIRPNGFFSDMNDFLRMAQSGRVYLFGKGSKKLNPIHGADLAKFCIEQMKCTNKKEYTIGGPDILSQKQIAVLAFSALEKKTRITFLPDVIRVLIIKLLHLLTSSKVYGPYEFFLTAMARDNIAPLYGNNHLKEYFDKIYKEKNAIR